MRAPCPIWQQNADAAWQACRSLLPARAAFVVLKGSHASFPGVGGLILTPEHTMIHFRAANSTLSPDQAQRLDLYLASQGLGCNLSRDRTSREMAFARLDRLPDGALRAMGLTRAGLAAHVYRDLFPSDEP
jgi:hypothetical protein